MGSLVVDSTTTATISAPVAPSHDESSSSRPSAALHRTHHRPSRSQAAAASNSRLLRAWSYALAEYEEVRAFEHAVAESAVEAGGWTDCFAESVMDSYAACAPLPPPPPVLRPASPPPVTCHPVFLQQPDWDPRDLPVWSSDRQAWVRPGEDFLFVYVKVKLRLNIYWCSETDTCRLFSAKPVLCPLRPDWGEGYQNWLDIGHWHDTAPPPATTLSPPPPIQVRVGSGISARPHMSEHGI